ncbi:response regulator [Rhizobium sp. BK650]|uniref:response regulator n=1 Tax=Rhizobium sp. BK650 TaxID=2586990 RepID=UPI00160860B1
MVDDDRNFRVALDDMLASAGLRAELYTSGEDFVTRKGYLTCDWIISDLRMPGMSGIELLRRLREDGIEQPVIIMTPIQTRMQRLSLSNWEPVRFSASP